MLLKRWSTGGSSRRKLTSVNDLGFVVVSVLSFRRLVRGSRELEAELELTRKSLRAV